MDITKPYEFIGFGAMDITKPYGIIGFGAMDITKPYGIIGFGGLAALGSEQQQKEETQVPPSGHLKAVWPGAL